MAREVKWRENLEAKRDASRSLPTQSFSVISSLKLLDVKKKLNKQQKV